MTPAPLLEPVRGVFRAVALSVVPECDQLQPEEWSALEAIIEHALAERPESLRKQLVTFLRVIELMPVLRHATRFTRLDTERRQRVLESLQNSRAALFRRGFWGLRTLIFMGYYARPEAAATVGYRASPEGWAARRQASPSSRPIT
ncbi:MAG: hypothetical protein U0163_13930 [Gemmatimonadaceae bacterium]